MHYCGQAGLDRGCITFDALRTPTTAAAGNSSVAEISAGDPLSSFVKQSATVHGMDSALLLMPSVTAPVLVDGNVVRIALRCLAAAWRYCSLARPASLKPLLLPACPALPCSSGARLTTRL
jgi:hypothetical protein